MSFSIGAYSDMVLCDVVKMDAKHVLLGRPCKFDHQTRHDGCLNRYIFTLHWKCVTLLPLSPNEVLQDYVERNRSKAIEEAKQNSWGTMGALLESSNRTARVEHPAWVEHQMIKLDHPFSSRPSALVFMLESSDVPAWPRSFAWFTRRRFPTSLDRSQSVPGVKPNRPRSHQKSYGCLKITRI